MPNEPLYATTQEERVRRIREASANTAAEIIVKWVAAGCGDTPLRELITEALVEARS